MLAAIRRASSCGEHVRLPGLVLVSPEIGVYATRLPVGVLDGTPAHVRGRTKGGSGRVVTAPTHASLQAADGIEIKDDVVRGRGLLAMGAKPGEGR